MPRYHPNLRLPIKTTLGLASGGQNHAKIQAQARAAR
jgi:hypothetical protein